MAGKVAVIAFKVSIIVLVFLLLVTLASTIRVSAEEPSCSIDYTMRVSNPREVDFTGQCQGVPEGYYPVAFGDGSGFDAFVDSQGGVAKTQNWWHSYNCEAGNCPFTVSITVGTTVFSKEIIVDPRTEPPFCTIGVQLVGEDPFSRLFVVACDNTADGYHSVTFGDGSGFDMKLAGGVAEFPHSYACDSTSCTYTLEVKIGELVFSKEVIITPVVPTETATASPTTTGTPEPTVTVEPGTPEPTATSTPEPKTTLVYVPVVVMKVGPATCLIEVSSGIAPNERTFKVLYHNVSPGVWWTFEFGDGAKFDILYPNRDGEMPTFGHFYPWTGGKFEVLARVGQGILDFCSAEVVVE